MDELTLYYFSGCPYCKKVLNYIEKNDLNEEIDFKNTMKDNEAKEKLVEVGGKHQVPCLFIEGDPLYESDDIVDWLEENLN